MLYLNMVICYCIDYIIDVVGLNDRLRIVNSGFHREKYE